MVRICLCAVALASLLSVAACSDNGEELRPCPPKGIGVEDFDGFSAGEQVLEYQQYNCKEAQICPDNNIAFFDPAFLIDENAAPRQVTVGVTNCSTGNTKLTIEKAILVGDPRCSFTCQCRRDSREPCQQCQVAIQKRDIDPGETVSIMIEYQPTSPGEDHAAFHVFSNAQNFQPLVTPMCALAVASEDATGDAGATTDAGDTPQFTCELVTEVNTTCHAE